MLYIAVFVVSALTFAVNMILFYTEKIKDFGIEDFDNGFNKLSIAVKKLFKIKPAATVPIIPVKKFFPQNLTLLLLMLMTGSAVGFLFSIAGMAWYFSLPCSVSSGLLLCFLVQYLIENAVDSVKKNRLPKGEEAAGLDGYCTESIEQGGWGKAILFYKDREFEVNAGDAIGNEEGGNINQNEKVIAVYESGGFYFVTRVDKIYADIDTRF